MIYFSYTMSPESLIKKLSLMFITEVDLLLSNKIIS